MGKCVNGFCCSFPLSRKGHEYLYVIMDRFGKICVLTPCKNQINVEKIDHLFFQFVWVHFWFPTSIVSNQDSHFLGELWMSLWRMLDTKLKRSTTFHPQTNGKTKVVNHTMIHLLWGYHGKHPKLWDEKLPYVQHAYNRDVHSPITTHCSIHVLDIFQRIP